MKTNNYKLKPQCLEEKLKERLFAFMCNNFHFELLFISLVVPHNLISCIERLSKRDKRDSATKLLATVPASLFILYPLYLSLSLYTHFFLSFCSQYNEKSIQYFFSLFPPWLVMFYYNK